MSNIVSVIGTGTIGEPLIGLLADHRDELGIDEVRFSKRTPLVEERAKVADLVRRGARLAVFEDRRASFEAMGMVPTYSYEEAVEEASVVIDCTPAGNENKDEVYESTRGPIGFLAQGSEHGFGKPYARGINDSALVHGDDRFVQVVSCNTHAIAAMLKSLALPGDRNRLIKGRFVVMRRASDISQDDGYVPSPTVDKHDDERFGTHHARDAHELFATIGQSLDVFSTAIKMPTQYMHLLHFSLELDEVVTKDEVLSLLDEDPLIAMTHRRSANTVFSFGRDHGSYGRLLSHAIVPRIHIAVNNGNEVVGTAFVPQDGNSLLSSITATLWMLDPSTADQRLESLQRYIFREV